MGYFGDLFGRSINAKLRKLEAIKAKQLETDSIKPLKTAFKIFSKASDPLVEQKALEILEAGVRRCKDKSKIAEIVNLLNEKENSAKTMLARMAREQESWKTLASMLESDKKVQERLASLEEEVTARFFEWILDKGSGISDYTRGIVFYILLDKLKDNVEKRIELAERFISDRDDLIATRAIIILLNERAGWEKLVNALREESVREIISSLSMERFSEDFLNWLARSHEAELSNRAFAISVLGRIRPNGKIWEELLEDPSPEIAVLSLMSIISRGRLAELDPKKARYALEHMLADNSEWETLAPILIADERLKEIVAEMEYEKIGSFLFWLMRADDPALRILRMEINAQRDAKLLMEVAFERSDANREQRYSARKQLIRLAMRSRRVRLTLSRRVAELETLFEGAENFEEQLWAAEVLSDFASMGLLEAHRSMSRMITEMQDIVEEDAEETNPKMVRMAEFILRRFSVPRTSDSSQELDDSDITFNYRIEPKAFSYEDALKAIRV